MLARGCSETTADEPNPTQQAIKVRNQGSANNKMGIKIRYDDCASTLMWLGISKCQARATDRRGDVEDPE
jgi:hypothetical protein